MALKTAGTQSITATDTANPTITGTFTANVVAAASSTFVVAGFPTTTAGASHSFTVTAEDAYGNLTAGYTGTVHFTSTDAKAVLPVDTTFTAVDAGVHTFAASLATADSQTIVATDTVAGTIKGSQAGVVVTPGAAASFVVTGFPATTAGVRKLHRHRP